MIDTRIDYHTNVVEARRLCDREPTLTVNLYRRVTTIEHRPDGTTITTEDREQLVETWTYQHQEPKEADRA